MKMFNKEEVFEIFDSLFRFDDYENGYVTSGMAKKCLQKNGIIKSIEDTGDDCKEFTRINFKPTELERSINKN
ncbi:MAG: hypothetical protein QNK84_04505 [Flavobacteriales bacterium]|jgi:hypothetical protein